MAAGAAGEHARDVRREAVVIQLRHAVAVAFHQEREALRRADRCAQHAGNRVSVPGQLLAHAERGDHPVHLRHVAEAGADQQAVVGQPGQEGGIAPHQVLEDAQVEVRIAGGHPVEDECAL